MLNSTVIFQIQSTLIVALLLFGVAKRRNKALHVKTMLTAIIWDVILVLQIELTRGAIAKASKAPQNSTILNIHVALAVSTVIFYIFMILSGKKLLNGDQSIRSRHRILGLTTLSLRLLTYITSYFAVPIEGLI